MITTMAESLSTYHCPYTPSNTLYNTTPILQPHIGNTPYDANSANNQLCHQL